MTRILVNNTEILISTPLNELEDDDYVDPMFFEPSYDLAAATGFAVWEGALVLIDFLNSKTDASVEFKSLITNNKVVELGSGTGVAGMGIAAAGASVLLTDLDCVVDLIQKNIKLNQKPGLVASNSWNNAVKIGNGSAVAQSLDWKQEIEAIPNDPREALVVIAAETAWLKSLVPHFVKTVATLLDTAKVCYWSYKERGNVESEFFTTQNELESLFEQFGCVITPVFKKESKEEPGKFVTVNTIKKHCIY